MFIHTAWLYAFGNMQVNFVYQASISVHVHTFDMVAKVTE